MSQPIPQLGRTAKNSKPKPHPFTAYPNLTGEKHALTLRLPTVKGNPLPSPDRIHNWDIDTAEPTFAPFTVDGIWMPPTEALPIFLDYSTPRAGTGASYQSVTCFRYWNKVAILTLEALATQKLIPVIDGEDARRLPVLDSPRDAQSLNQLEAAIPPICRAEPTEDGEHLSPHVLLNSFLNTLCDSLSREWSRVTAPKIYLVMMNPLTVGWKHCSVKIPSFSFHPTSYRISLPATKSECVTCTLPGIRLSE